MSFCTQRVSAAEVTSGIKMPNPGRNGGLHPVAGLKMPSPGQDFGL